MKFKHIFILLFSLTFLFTGCENEMAPTESIAGADESGDLERGHWYRNWEKANIELEEKFLKAIANKDFEGFASCFWDDPDFCFVTAFGAVVRGGEDNRQGIKDLFDVMETIEAEIHWVDRWRIGKVVYAVGEASFKMTMYDGTVVAYKEVWTDGRMKVKGKWVIFLNHAHMLTP